MKLIRVGAAVLNQTPLDWQGNRRNILATIRQAKEEDVGLLCLPELAITGHGCEDAFQSPAVQRTALEILFEIAGETQGLSVAVGLPLAILHPRRRVTLVESRERRHHFQRAAVRELGLGNVEPQLGRAESLEARPHDAVVAQAMARQGREFARVLEAEARPPGRAPA